VSVVQVFTNWLYFYVIAAFNGVPLAITHAKVAREFVPLLIDNWKVWPAVSLVNFAFVPPQLQVLFGNVISIFCTTQQRGTARRREMGSETLQQLTCSCRGCHCLAAPGTAYVVAITR